MTGDKHVKEKRTISPTKSAVVIIAFVALVMLVVMLISGYNLKNKISDNNARAEELQEKIDSENERTNEIEELEEYMQSDEYLEQEAKDKLGFVKDGEIIFKENN